MLQLDLFKKQYTDIYKASNINFSFIELADITFRGGLKESVHRWFRLTPSYSPELVRFFFKYLRCNKNTAILDPFVGKGTTLIECKKSDYPAFGVEINPLLFEVTKKSLQWNYDIKKLKKINASFLNKLKELVEKNKEFSCEQYCKRENISIPIIRNPFRWWKNDVLKELLIIRTLLKEMSPKNFQPPFWLALCVSCLDCANIHRNHPTISFDDNHNREINPIENFINKISTIIFDIETLSTLKNSNKIEIFLADSIQNLKPLIKKNIDCVITSPPYPNRFSYIHTTRPQLYFMEILNDIVSATEIDINAIGGTWGRATSSLMKKEAKPHKDIQNILSFRKKLKKKSLLMCNYATKYFNKMYEHTVELKKIVSMDFRGVYIVGNTRLKGVEIHTELVLAKIFERCGFKVDEILIFRKRGGKKELYESAVCIQNKN